MSVVNNFISSYNLGTLIPMAIDVVRQRDRYSIITQSDHILAIAERFRSVLTEQEESDLFIVMSSLDNNQTFSGKFASLCIRSYSLEDQLSKFKL